jgi:hypothetical protein
MTERDADYYKAKDKEHATEAAKGLEKLDHLLYELNTTKWTVRDALDFICKLPFGEQESPESRKHYDPIKDLPEQLDKILSDRVPADGHEDQGPLLEMRDRIAKHFGLRLAEYHQNRTRSAHW